jgi:dTDP-4-dehydrorhamnose reductase
MPMCGVIVERDPEHVEPVVAEVSPHLDVDATSGGSDWVVTAEGAVRVAMAAAKQGFQPVHVSNDAVLSGARTRLPGRVLPA